MRRLAGARRQCAPARHHAGAPARALRSRRARRAAAGPVTPLYVVGPGRAGRDAAARAATPVCHHGRETSAVRVRAPRGRCRMKTAPLSRRDRLRQILADLRMPGALEALDAILRDIDGGALTAPDAIEQ